MDEPKRYEPSRQEYDLAYEVERLASYLAREGLTLNRVEVGGAIRPTLQVMGVMGPTTVIFHQDLLIHRAKLGVNR